ncbi:MAG: metallophosphoesterase [Clostridia bacterium]|nr:metallophosphoesterase [Clostridia bacterium]
MKYYVVSDTHGFYTLTIEALKEKGYFDYNGDKKIIICGDLLDRGKEPNELVNFTYEKMKNNELVFVRGNHEDLFLDLFDNFLKYYMYCSFPHHHQTNGTLASFYELAGEIGDTSDAGLEMLNNVKNNHFYNYIIPNSVNYFETKNYVFTHGWIPSEYNENNNKFEVLTDWRELDEKTWSDARWLNGMSYANLGAILDNKTIVCGHWHASWGHHYLENKNNEFGSEADYSPFYAKGIIAIDACTALSNQVNCIVIDDDELPNQ